MNEMIRQARNPAHQDLVVNAKGRNIVRRWAVCPDHHKRTSMFLYPDERGWRFICPWTRHEFYAEPDKSAPTTVEQIEEWTKRMLQARLERLSQKGQQ